MATDRLYFTENDEADRLIARDPMALLIGFVLDQQVPVQKAFSGPMELQQRIGTLDAARIAAMEPEKLAAAFSERPALHRFPAAMAKRVRALAAAVAERYGDDPARIWTEARDARDLERRIGELPGFGGMKVRSLLAVLVKRLGVKVAGAEERLPDYPTLGDVDSPQALADYQAKKRAHKAAQREAGREFKPWADAKEAAAYAGGSRKR
jgi:uncharacterized HhH-GPD family protein